MDSWNYLNFIHFGNPHRLGLIGVPKIHENELISKFWNLYGRLIWKLKSIELMDFENWNLNNKMDWFFILKNQSQLKTTFQTCLEIDIKSTILTSKGPKFTNRLFWISRRFWHCQFWVLSFKFFFENRCMHKICVNIILIQSNAQEQKLWHPKQE